MEQTLGRIRNGRVGEYLTAIGRLEEMSIARKL